MRSGRPKSHLNGANSDDGDDGDADITRAGGSRQDLYVFIYFVLGMYAVFSAFNLFVSEAQVMELPLPRVYACLCAGGAGGAGLFALVHRGFLSRPRLMRGLFGVSYGLSPVLVALSVLCALARLPSGLVWVAFAGVFAMIGFNLSMSASLINLMMREMGRFGIRLGLSLAAGIAAATIPAQIFAPAPEDAADPQAADGFFVASAAGYAAAVGAMALLSFRWAEVPKRLSLAEAEYGDRGMNAGVPGRQYFGSGVPIRRILVGNAATILVFSFWIGANDVYAAFMQQASPDAFGLPLILFIAPGLAIGGVLADIGKGTLLSLGAVGCTLLLAPLSVALGAPESHPEVFWGAGVVHGFFLFHITFVLPSVISFGKHSPAVFSMVGVLYFVGSGLGAILSEDFVAMNGQLQQLLIAAAAFGVLLAFLLFSGVQPFGVRGRSGGVFSGAPAATTHSVIPAPEPESTHDTLAYGDVPSLADFVATHRLTERETDVLACLLKGYSTDEMMKELYVTESTIRFHIRSILKKTGAKRRIEVVAMYNSHAG